MKVTSTITIEILLIRKNENQIVQKNNARVISKWLKFTHGLSTIAIFIQPYSLKRPLTMLLKSNNQMSYTDLTSIHKSFLKMGQFFFSEIHTHTKTKMLRVFSIH